MSVDGKNWQQVASSETRQPFTEAHRIRRLVDRVITDQQRQRRADWKAQLAEVDRQIAEIPPLPNWWVGTFKQVDGPFHIFEGGSPQKPGAVVVPASLSALEAGST